MILEQVKALEYSKIRALNQLANKETINLGIGRPFCKTPEYIKKAAIDAINNDETYYSSNYGIKALRNEISKRYSKGNFNNALVTIGAAEGIYLVMRSLLEAGDEVLIPNPGYLAYEPIGRLTGATCKFYELTENYQLSFESISNNISDHTKMIIINNPGNPTGVAFKEKDLEKLVQLANEKGIIILSDEAYQGLNYSGNRVKSLYDFNHDDNVIAISSVSKEFSMTGWRIGWIYGNQGFIDEMVKHHLLMNSCASTISQYAALEGLKNNKGIVINQLKKNKNIMASFLEKIKHIKYVHTEAGLYYFIDVSFYGNDDEITMELLKQKNVLVIPGSAFGSKGKGHLRLSFGAKPDDIREAMTRIIDYFNSID